MTNPKTAGWDSNLMFGLGVLLVYVMSFLKPEPVIILTASPYVALMLGDSFREFRIDGFVKWAKRIALAFLPVYLIVYFFVGK